MNTIGDFYIRQYRGYYNLQNLSNQELEVLMLLYERKLHTSNSIDKESIADATECLGKIYREIMSRQRQESTQRYFSGQHT